MGSKAVESKFPNDGCSQMCIIDDTGSIIHWGSLDPTIVSVQDMTQLKTESGEYVIDEFRQVPFIVKGSPLPVA